MGILELQVANTNNLLPGAKKSIPYVTETGGLLPFLFRTISKDAQVIFFWKMIELNKVCSSPPSSQNPCSRKLRNFARTLWNPREPWTSWLTFYVMDSR